MSRLAYLAAGLVLLVSTAAPAHATNSWRVVCKHDATAREPMCHIATLAQDEKSGAWLGVAVQILNGSHEVQVTSGGSAYRSAEIDAEPNTTTYTDFCYGTYCVFVHAEDLIARFKSEKRMDVRLFNGQSRPAIEKRISLLGFTKAYEEYLGHVGE